MTVSLVRMEISGRMSQWVPRNRVLPYFSVKTPWKGDWNRCSWLAHLYIKGKLADQFQISRYWLTLGRTVSPDAIATEAQKIKVVYNTLRTLNTLLMKPSEYV